MKDVRWEEFDLSRAVQEDILSWEERMERFFLNHTVEELEKRAEKEGIRLAGVKDISQVVNDPHLEVRGYWQRFEGKEKDRDILYPGFLFLSNITDSRPRSLAPLVGEHNLEVYGKLLGLSESEVEGLKEEGVI